MIGRTLISFITSCAKMRCSAKDMMKSHNRAWKIQRQIRIKRAFYSAGMRQPVQTENIDRNGVKKICWRCLYHMEKGNDACPQSRN
ncbi:MAG: hypothetical protein ACLR56_15275 [Oscillospiraceae bacterium]